MIRLNVLGKQMEAIEIEVSKAEVELKKVRDRFRGEQL
jgi:hypothetical protein